MRLLALLLLTQAFVFSAKAQIVNSSGSWFDFSKDYGIDRSEEKYHTNDYCFQTCGVLVYTYKECKSFAESIEEKNICITEEEKICLMECKNIKLDETGMKQKVFDRSGDSK